MDARRRRRDGLLVAGAFALLLMAGSRVDPRPIFLHYAALRIKPGESEAEVWRKLGEGHGIGSGPMMDCREGLSYADVRIDLRNHRVVSVCLAGDRS